MFILNFQWNLKVNLLMHMICFAVETFQVPIQLQRLEPLAISLALWNIQWDWISVIQGRPAHAKGCRGILPCLHSLRYSGLLRGRWLPDWSSSQPETEKVKGNRTLVSVCAPWAGSYGSLIPRAEWVLFTSYFTESQLSENVLTVSKWHFYVA